jgi:hypothetical protein
MSIAPTSAEDYFVDGKWLEVVRIEARHSNPFNDCPIRSDANPP